jgi:hypothetical protein
VRCEGETRQLDTGKLKTEFKFYCLKVKRRGVGCNGGEEAEYFIMLLAASKCLYLSVASQRLVMATRI